MEQISKALGGVVDNEPRCIAHLNNPAYFGKTLYRVDTMLLLMLPNDGLSYRGSVQTLLSFLLVKKGDSTRMTLASNDLLRVYKRAYFCNIRPHVQPHTSLHRTQKFAQ